MDNEKLKKIKVLYFPYKTIKKIMVCTVDYVHYIISLIYIKRNKERVKEKIKNKEVLNVLFVVQYIPGWNKLEPIYTKMKKDDRFNPIIVCVPFNIQNHQLIGDYEDDTYAFFVNKGYEAINAFREDGSWFDLKELSPDYLFHSRPYNHFMPVPYTSGKIVKYALICNVLYGLSFDTNMLSTIINRNYYRDVYCYFSADSSERNYYKSRFKIGFKLGITCCEPYGAIGLEQILNSKTEKKNASFRKTIIWTPRWSTDSLIGGSNFFNYKSFIIRFAKENPDVLFVIRPHPLMFNNFIKTGEMTQIEVDDFKAYCCAQKNISLDEEKEYSESFWNSDLLITDISSVVPEYFVTGKPIAYCHSEICFYYLDYAKAIIESSYEVFNSNDLVKIVNSILNDEDEKYEERNKVMNQFFSGILNSSDNVIKKMANV